MDIAFLVFAQPDPGHASRQQLTLAVQLAPLLNCAYGVFADITFSFLRLCRTGALVARLPNGCVQPDIVTAGIITSL